MMSYDEFKEAHKFECAQEIVTKLRDDFDIDVFKVFDGVMRYEYDVYRMSQDHGLTVDDIENLSIDGFIEDWTPIK